MISQTSRLPVEGEIKELYHELEPDRRFIQTLEKDLRAQCHRLAAETDVTRRHQLRNQARWALIPATLVLILMVTVLVIGPQTVLSALLEIGGYISGVGFVYAPTTRLLAEPVSVRLSEDLELHIDQLVAGVDRTIVTVRLEGDDATADTWTRLTDRESVDIALVHPQGYHYRLIEAPMRAPNTPSSDGVSGFWIFTQLPSSMNSMTLEISEMGEESVLLSPEEPVTMRLGVEPATVGAQATEITHVQRLGITSEPGPQQCTLTVHQAAYGAEQTGIDVEASCGRHKHVSLDRTSSPLLIDDAGKTYTETGKLESLQPMSSDRKTYDFPPITSEAQMLTLRTDTLSVFDQGLFWRTEFALDLGPNPQIGQTWPLDIKLGRDEAPFHFYITEAVLQKSEPCEQNCESYAPYYLRLTIQVRDLPSDHELRGLTGSTSVRPDSLPSWAGFYWSARVEEGDREKGQMTGYIRLGELPEAPFSSTLSGVGYKIEGPWEISWAIDRTP